MQHETKASTQEWARIRRISRWGNSRRVRRLVVLLWIVVLVIDPFVVMRFTHGLGALAKLPHLVVATLTQLLITWVAFRAMQTGLAQPPVSDSALMHFGAEFDALSETEREELLRARSRELLLGRLQRDEREAELQMHAERTAYRLLRPGLAVLVAVYWAVCLLGPFGALRGTLVLTAAGLTWIAVAVLVLPTMVRMWSQPNEAGETRIAQPGRQ